MNKETLENKGFKPKKAEKKSASYNKDSKSPYVYAKENNCTLSTAKKILNLT